MPMKIEIWNEDETIDCDTVTVVVPSKFEVCPRCEGKGKHVNPNIDGHGITSEEWENDWDDESREMYLKGGYDVVCYTCNGLRVIEIPDPTNANEETRTAIAQWERECDERAQSEAEDRHTSRMESGGRDW